MQTPTNNLSGHYSQLLNKFIEIAELRYFQGEVETALQFWQIGEPFTKLAGVQVADQARFYQRYGAFLIDQFYLVNRNEEPMISTVQRAHQLAETTGDEDMIARSFLLWGKMLYFQCLHKGNDGYAEVRDYLHRAAALCEKQGNDYDLAEILFYTGLTYDRQQEGSPEAKAHYLRALDLGERYDNKWAASEATRHLTDHSEGEQRLNYAQRSLNLRYAMHFRRALPSAQLLLSDLHIQRGELAQALDYCQQAEQLASEMGLQFYLLWVWVTYGDIALQEQKPREARAHFEKAREFAQQVNTAFALNLIDEKLKTFEQ